MTNDGSKVIVRNQGHNKVLSNSGHVTDSKVNTLQHFYSNVSNDFDYR